MRLRPMICEICGGAEFVEKNGLLVCIHCDANYPKHIEESEEAKEARILRISRLDDAEKELRMSPPHFDAAEDKFLELIRQYPEWSVGYWGVVRSKYGIKYELDIEGKAIPSCYKSSYEDFRNDTYFKKAVAFAENETIKAKYQSQGDRIAHTCKEWREKASRFDYDIFISFKATENGEETRDAREMQNLYTFLTEQGYKVFFSPVSMRSIVGKSDWDAYIFNALEKAKIMILYGSNVEYFTTTWVENEWTRYLRMIERGTKNPDSLIIAYENFNVASLPRQLRKIQAINGEDRTFYITLTRRIKDILSSTNDDSITDKELSIDRKISPISPLHEHKYITEVIAASCVAKGYTIHKCSCGYSYKDNYTDLAAHTFDKWIEQIRPSCTTQGKRVRQCKLCGFVDTEEIPCCEHQWRAKRSTDGRTIIEICNLCGQEKIVDGHQSTDRDDTIVDFGHKIPNLSSTENYQESISVIGVGSAGANTINRISGYDRILVESTTAKLEANTIKPTVLLDLNEIKGNLCLSNNDTSKINSIIEKYNTLLICAGLGGNTGSIVTPMIAKLAKDQRKFVIAVVFKPFSFEGGIRSKNAEKSIDEIKNNADVIICVANDKLRKLGSVGSMANAFMHADKVVSEASEIVSKLSFNHSDRIAIKKEITERLSSHFSANPLTELIVP